LIDNLYEKRFFLKQLKCGKKKQKFKYTFNEQYKNAEKCNKAQAILHI
jgi:hypothetical protein